MTVFEDQGVGFVLPAARSARVPQKEKREGRTRVGPNLQQSVLWMRFGGRQQAAKPVGDDLLETKSNYYLGSDPSRWHTQIPNYGRLRYANVYDGIDVDFHGEQGRLEYDFVVGPHNDPSNILMGFQGATEIEVKNGAAILRLPGGKLTFERPHVFQEREGKKVDVEGEFVLRGQNRLGFRVGAYDRSQMLVIDPVLNYGTYLVGVGSSDAIGITQTLAVGVDTAGEAVVAGIVGNESLPDLGLMTSDPTPIDQYVFVVKLNTAGNGLIFSNLFAGDGYNFLRGLALDPQGGIYFTGAESESTSLANYPTTPGAYSTSVCTNCSGAAGFLTKLSPSGGLAYSTYLSSVYAVGEALTVDAHGDAYVAGTTSSPDMQIVGGFQSQGFAFVQEFDPNGQNLLYSTYFDGSIDTSTNATAVRLDGGGNVYVTGTTGSPYFPVQNAIQIQPLETGVTLSGFLIKFTPSSGVIDYSTYISDLGDTYVTGMAVDGSGAAYLTGTTNGADFPITANSYIAPCLPSLDDTSGSGACGGTEAFALKVDPSGSSLNYSSLLGPASENGIALDSAGNAYLTGGAQSPAFPTVNAIQPTWPGTGFFPAFVMELDSTGTPVFSTYLGGLTSGGAGTAIAVDASGGVYAAGLLQTGEFPLLNAYRSSVCCSDAIFAAKIDMASGGPVATLSQLDPGQYILRNMGTAPLDIDQISPTPPSGSCVPSITLSPGGVCDTFVGSQTTALTITGNSPSSPQVFSVSPGTGAAQGLVIVPGELWFGNTMQTMSPLGQSGHRGNLERCPLCFRKRTPQSRFNNIR